MLLEQIEVEPVDDGTEDEEPSDTEDRAYDESVNDTGNFSLDVSSEVVVGAEEEIGEVPALFSSPIVQGFLKFGNL